MRIPLVIFAIMASCALAEDWPQFLGTTRNGVYSGGDLAAKWSKGGPAVDPFRVLNLACK